MAETRKTVTWIYAGRELQYSKNVPKLVHVFYDNKEFHDDNVRAESKCYAGIRKKVIGGTYEGEVSEDGNTAYAINSWKYQGRADDPDSQEIFAEWGARDTASDATYKYHQAEKRDVRFDPMYERLQPIKDAYWHTSGPGRRAILLKVLSYIMGGKH